MKKLEDDFYVYGKTDEERFEELSEGQRAVIDSITATLEALDAQADLSPLTQADTLREAWEAADMADKRMLLKCALGKKGITVKPPRGRGTTPRSFNGSRSTGCRSKDTTAKK
ncbi:hypothetical protein ACIOHC_23895 [Streptomyces sp. NPDC088252]|uniref:hypothetical protein n=1 Tax=Streptomyces sp. NPDC088252 TaxID=3365845 RepID=UPI00382DA4C0